MVHGILQFTPSIAFRYVLHRCESRDIRCRESFVFQNDGTSSVHEARMHFSFTFLGAFRARFRRPVGTRRATCLGFTDEGPKPPDARPMCFTR